MTGRTISNYQIGEKPGEGGLEVIYKASSEPRDVPAELLRRVPRQGLARRSTASRFALPVNAGNGGMTTAVRAELCQ
jgi:hypothetical protein